MAKPAWWGFVAVAVAVVLLSARPGYSVTGDVVFQRETQDSSTPPATLPHWFHRIRYACAVCHPAISPMENKPGLVTMEKIGEGKFCGACHNGRVAFAVSFETCRRCHGGP